MRTKISPSIKALQDLIAYLSTIRSWSIKNDDTFMVTWIERDGSQNYIDDGNPTGFLYRCGNDTLTARIILNKLGWSLEQTLGIVVNKRK